MQYANKKPLETFEVEKPLRIRRHDENLSGPTALSNKCISIVSEPICLKISVLYRYLPGQMEMLSAGISGSCNLIKIMI